MGIPATPVDRTIARAWGIRVKGSLAGDELRAMVREASRGFGENATRHQLRLARQWGLELDGPTDIQTVARRLLRFGAPPARITSTVLWSWSATL